jgi:ABC-type lipoprotein export system ATPase subunit
MSTAITLVDVEKTYHGDGVVTRALQSVTLTLDKGQFTAILGPSGSGKTTLLTLIGTLDRPTAGTIRYGDVDVLALKGKRIADFRFEHIGFVFQQFHLLPALTALENVMAPLFSRKVSYDKKARARELLAWVGLEAKSDALPSQLSGGEQQRVAIARALVNRPDWLLADEPTGNLDTRNSENIVKLLRTYQQEHGSGIVLITHDQTLADQAERIIEMRDGRIVSDSGKETG